MINWYKIKAYYIQQYLDDLKNNDTSNSSK